MQEDYGVRYASVLFNISFRMFFYVLSKKGLYSLFHDRDAVRNPSSKMPKLTTLTFIHR